MLFNIFLNIIAPIFILILIGGVLDRTFKLDIKTLTRINFYVVVPAVLFVKMQNAEADLSIALPAAAFVVLQIVLLLGLSFLSRLLIKDEKKRTITALSMIFTNCGNMGIRKSRFFT